MLGDAARRRVLHTHKRYQVSDAAGLVIDDARVSVQRQSTVTKDRRHQTPMDERDFLPPQAEPWKCAVEFRQKPYDFSLVRALIADLVFNSRLARSRQKTIPP